MALNKIFINAIISQVNPNAFQLTLTYSYYYLYHYTEQYVYNNLNEAKNALIEFRCAGRLIVPKDNKDNNEETVIR